MNNYVRRWGTALVLLGTVSGCLQFQFSSIILAQIIMQIGIWEYQGISEKIVANAFPEVKEMKQEHSKGISKVFGTNIGYLLKYNMNLQCGILLFSIYTFIGDEPKPLEIIYPLYMFCVITTFLLKIFISTSITGDIRDKEGKWGVFIGSLLFDICLEVIGITLFGLCFAFYGILYYKCPQLILVGLSLVFQTDHGALLFGSRFGKTPINRFYYNKTMEGCLGGVGFCILNSIGMKLEAGFLTKLIFPNWITIGQYLTLGVGVGILGILGDLLESFLKRCAGVKDSSNLLPGHGGIFDRIDSVLMAAPFLVYYYYLELA